MQQVGPGPQAPAATVWCAATKGASLPIAQFPGLRYETGLWRQAHRGGPGQAVGPGAPPIAPRPKKKDLLGRKFRIMRFDCKNCAHRQA